MKVIELEHEKQKRGFACMTPEQRREIASKGGKSVDPKNRAFSKDNELARDAGQKGGINSHKNKERRNG